MAGTSLSGGRSITPIGNIHTYIHTYIYIYKLDLKNLTIFSLYREREVGQSKSKKPNSSCEAYCKLTCWCLSLILYKGAIYMSNSLLKCSLPKRSQAFSWPKLLKPCVCVCVCVLKGWVCLGSIFFFFFNQSIFQKALSHGSRTRS
ncbi:hypothetical protein CROQUDRAFT_404105 [Cronartium quercuum f. sp. fusiforme G11]|uniref:Uncharacterized protein n=1 Tax=Cronartium quercuum f. sp. fusiforme G11 TaxID=708437 RepID=A0A9P6THN0_9BASI|nr:hypothetical protein CROQUDRAFT_404105 [Cronartium quercuum f. sp. fusiforme G11]